MRPGFPAPPVGGRGSFGGKKRYDGAASVRPSGTRGMVRTVRRPNSAYFNDVATGSRCRAGGGEQEAGGEKRDEATSARANDAAGGRRWRERDVSRCSGVPPCSRMLPRAPGCYPVCSMNCDVQRGTVEMCHVAQSRFGARGSGVTARMRGTRGRQRSCNVSRGTLRSLGEVGSVVRLSRSVSFGFGTGGVPRGTAHWFGSAVLVLRLLWTDPAPAVFN